MSGRERGKKEWRNELGNHKGKIGKKTLHEEIFGGKIKKKAEGRGKVKEMRLWSEKKKTEGDHELQCTVLL